MKDEEENKVGTTAGPGADGGSNEHTADETIAMNGRPGISPEPDGGGEMAGEQTPGDAAANVHASDEGMPGGKEDSATDGAAGNAAEGTAEDGAGHGICSPSKARDRKFSNVQTFIVAIVVVLLVFACGTAIGAGAGAASWCWPPKGADGAQAPQASAPESAASASSESATVSADASDEDVAHAVQKQINGLSSDSSAAEVRNVLAAYGALTEGQQAIVDKSNLDEQLKRIEHEKDGKKAKGANDAGASEGAAAKDAKKPGKKAKGTKGAKKAGKDEKASKNSQAPMVGKKHEHVWKTLYQDEKVPATYRTVHHKAKYRTTVERHTVCNECGKVIDGHAAAHIRKTGHSGYTTDAPVEVKKLVKKAWDQKVVATPARTVKRPYAQKCAKCGKVRALPKGFAKGGGKASKGSEKSSKKA